MVLEVLSKLEQIQELDLMIDKIVKAKAAFPARLAQFDQEIKTKNDQKESLLNKITELEKSHTQNRGALELNETRSNRSQERLAAVKNNDEYVALNKEIETLKKSTLAIQEADKKITDEIAKLRTDIGALETAIAGISEKKTQEQTKIDQEAGGVDQQLGELQSKRQALTPGIDPRILANYDRTRATRAGVGVAPVIGGICKGCNMRLMPQLYVEIQKLSEIHACPSCKRMLSFKPTAKA